MMSEKDKFNLILQSITRSGRQWDETVTLQVLADESFADLDVGSPLFGDMTWQANLVALEGQFFLKGSWKMNVPKACGKCNTEFSALMSGEVDVIYALGKGEYDDVDAELELTGNEPELLEDGELNVLDVLREHFWLAWQPMVVCSQDCKGLCLQCGVNLNESVCNCHAQVKENAFAALKNIKFDA